MLDTHFVWEAQTFYNSFGTAHLYITNVYWVWDPVIELYVLFANLYGLFQDEQKRKCSF